MAISLDSIKNPSNIATKTNPVESKETGSISNSVFELSTENIGDKYNSPKQQEKELENNIHEKMAPYLKKLGLNLSSEESVILFQKIAKTDIKSLLKDKSNLIDETLKILAEFTNYKIPCKNADDVLTYMRNIEIAIDCGMDPNEYVKDLKSQINTYGKPEGVKERIERFYPAYVKDFDKLSNEDKDKYLSLYINDYLVKNFSINTIQKDLVMLILSTDNDADREVYYSVIENLHKNEAFNKFPEEQRAKLTVTAIKALVASYENGDIATKHYNDNNGAQLALDTGATEEQMVELTAAVYNKAESKETFLELNDYVQNNINLFYEENKDILKTINEKYCIALQNNVPLELTEEEQKVFDEFKRCCSSQRAGQDLGIANNGNLPREIQILLLNEIHNSDAGNEMLQRESNRQVYEYLQENPDIINMSTEDFEKFMDEVTNGNYSIVKNDITNGTYTELNPPKAESEASGTSSIEETSETQAKEAETLCEDAPIGGIGYNNTPEPPSANPTEKLETILEKQDKAVTNPQQSQTPVTKTPTDILVAVRAGSLKKYKEDTRKTEQELTKELLNNGDKTTIEIGKELFAKFNKNTQELIFATLNNVACCAVLDLLSYKQLEKVKNSHDYYMQTEIEDKITEEKEKNKTGFEANV